MNSRRFIRGPRRRGRQCKAERLRGGQIYNEIEFGWLLDRDVTRLCPMQNLIDVVSSAPEKVRKVWSIRHQAARIDVVPGPVHRRKSLTQRQGVNSNPVGVCEGVSAHVKGIYAAFERLEGRRDIRRLPDFECDDLETECAGR
jgi:hypothetical protein